MSFEPGSFVLVSIYLANRPYLPEYCSVVLFLKLTFFTGELR